MNLVDTHCHVHFNAYKDDRDEVIRRGLDSGVRMITVGTQKDTSRVAVEVARQFDGLWASVGLHPNHLTAMEFDEDELPVRTRTEKFDKEYYRALASDPKVVAIGECGLDYYRLPTNVPVEDVKKLQEETFRQHIELAVELGKPLIVHCRDAHDDVLRILDKYVHTPTHQCVGVIHSFTGTWHDAERHLAQGFYIGINGIVTFPHRRTVIARSLTTKQSHPDEFLPDVVRRIPLDRLLLETDAPYLTPIPFRGKRNEPAHVRFVAGKIAELHGVSVEEVARQTTENAHTLFNLS